MAPTCVFVHENSSMLCQWKLILRYRTYIADVYIIMLYFIFCIICIICISTWTTHSTQWFHLSQPSQPVPPLLYRPHCRQITSHLHHVIFFYLFFYSGFCVVSKRTSNINKLLINMRHYIESRHDYACLPSQRRILPHKYVIRRHRLSFHTIDLISLYIVVSTHRRGSAARTPECSSPIQPSAVRSSINFRC